MQMSGVAFRRMVYIFAWSATYNVLAILLASGAFSTCASRLRNPLWARLSASARHHRGHDHAAHEDQDGFLVMGRHDHGDGEHSNG